MPAPIRRGISSHSNNNRDSNDINAYHLLRLLSVRCDIFYMDFCFLYNSRDPRRRLAEAGGGFMFPVVILPSWLWTEQRFLLALPS